MDSGSLQTLVRFDDSIHETIFKRKHLFVNSLQVSEENFLRFRTAAQAKHRPVSRRAFLFRSAEAEAQPSVNRVIHTFIHHCG